MLKAMFWRTIIHSPSAKNGEEGRKKKEREHLHLPLYLVAYCRCAFGIWHAVAPLLRRFIGSVSGLKKRRSAYRLCAAGIITRRRLRKRVQTHAA